MTIQAAGKTISTKNATKLKAAFQALTAVLIGAGIANAENLQQLLEDSTGEADDSTDTSAAGNRAEPDLEIAAEKFLSQVQRVTWHDRLKSTLKIFARRFGDAHNLTDQEYQDEYGEGETRQQAIQSMVADLSTILTELTRSHPGPAENWRDRYQGYEAPYSTFMLSAETGEQTPVNLVTLAFQCDATTEVAAKGGRRRGTKNRTPLTGTLFRIDEASEAVPAKGPGLPLYISKEVAASVLNTVAGLPLDAHDNLMEHADQDITGVMLSAEIKDQDFIVHGFLWPSSRATKVKTIEANQNKLGMSMTADAWGHEQEVDGRKVFWVDALELKGANILFSDCATYQKTRLIVAQKQQSGGRDPTAIAATATASTSQPPNPKEDPIMEELQKQMAAFIAAQTASTQTLTTQLQTLANQVTSLTENQTALAASVSQIEATRKAEQDAIAAQNAQQTQEQQASDMAAKIQAAVLEGLTGTIGEVATNAVNHALSRVMNPSRQPARQTTPLLAGAANQAQQTSLSAEAIELKLQIATINGELSSTRNMAQQIELLDKRRTLESQLLMLQPA